MEANELKTAPAVPPMTLSDAIGHMKAQGGTLSATVTVTRKETGATETHQLIFTPTKD